MNSITTTENYQSDSTEQAAVRRDLEKNLRLQYQCHIFSNFNVTREANETYCEPHYDLVRCWYAAKANTTVVAPCPAEIRAPDHVVAVRYCGADGQWTNLSDYQQCIDFIDGKYLPKDDSSLSATTQELSKAFLIMRDIYFGCSLVSLFFLCITLFVFCYFRSLQCNRVTIHKHLVVSFILRFVIIVFLFEPLVFGHDAYYTRVDWFCKTIIVLSQYTMVSNILWMFVEGLFLHNSIVVTVFSTDAPYKLFCAIGWGLPGIIAISWAIAMHLTMDTACWQNNSQSPYSYIVSGSILLALAVNLFFLVNIIRVLVTKLRAHNTHESSRIKKAIRATVILMPLLGLTNLIMLFNPNDGGSYASVYQVTNVVLHSNQGILISIFYCFLNGEVRRVIRQKYRRIKIQRILRNNSRRYSRTSSCVLSQTETKGDHSSSSDSNICMENLNNNAYQKVTLITEVREKTSSDSNLDNYLNIDVINQEKPKSDSNLHMNGDVKKQNSSSSDPSHLRITHHVKFRLTSSENDLEKCKYEVLADDELHRSSVAKQDAFVQVQSIEDNLTNESDEQSVTKNAGVHCDSEDDESSQNDCVVFEPHYVQNNEKNKSMSQLNKINSGSSSSKNNRFSVLSSSSEFNLNIASGFADEVTNEFLNLLRRKEPLLSSQ